MLAVQLKSLLNGFDDQEPVYSNGGVGDHLGTNQEAKIEFKLEGCRWTMEQW
jgi:hypothetical protein